jgi:CubicO group peptidase (beta-lactamase class C family)
MTTTATTPVPPELAEVVQAELARWSVPGMAVGVLHDGALEAWGFGVCSIDTGLPVTADTLFQVGSITKVFTATAVMQLVEEGTIALDEPVVRFLPDFRLADETATRTVTVRHLLTHLSGFWGDKFKDFGPGDDALAKALAEFHTLRQYTPPGTVWAYCNTGFQVLGALLERFDGKTAERATHDRVIAPLGLERSFFFAHEAITYRPAVGHNKLPGEDLQIARPYPLQRCMNAAGGIIGTVGDLLRFAAFHMGDDPPGASPVLSAATRRAMQEPQVEAALADHWGLGWSIRTVDGTAVVGHGGSTNGFRAQLALVPARRFALALLTNGSGGAAANRAAETWLLKRYAGLRRRDPDPIPLPDERLARFAGRYEQPLSAITVTVADGRLRFDVISKNPFTDRRIHQLPYHAVPVGERRFLIVDGEAAGGVVDFLLNEDGTVRFIRSGGRLADPVEARG